MVSCILFLVILLILFAKITWLFRGNELEAREDIQGFKNQEDIDVVLVGGSTFLRFYNPLQAWNETGITSYNYATSSAKFDIYKEYIKDSRRTNEAQLYVVDVRTIALLSPEIHEPSIRNWSDSLEPTSPERIRGITDYLYKREWDFKMLPSFYFDIIKYHSNTEALSSEKQWSFMNSNSINNIDKGFFSNLVSVPFDKPEWGESRSPLSEHQLKALNDILDYCDREKIQVLFVCCPYIFSESDEGIINSAGDIIKNRGYKYVNFNDYYDEIGLDFSTDFCDVNHTNYLGAIKYTHFLINYISGNYNLTDHRGEAEYAQWDLDYATFLPTMNENEAKLSAIVNEQNEAKELGEKLKCEQDFREWYSGIRNKNYTVIIRMNNIPKDLSTDNPMYNFLKDYSIDTLQEAYIGVWSGERAIVSTSHKSSVEANIGVSGGRGTDICTVSTEEEIINIAGVDYVADRSSIQVVVYDNNYKRVIDNVNIHVDVDDLVMLQRP